MLNYAIGIAAFLLVVAALTLAEQGSSTDDSTLGWFLAAEVIDHPGETYAATPMAKIPVVQLRRFDDPVLARAVQQLEPTRHSGRNVDSAANG